MSKRPHEPLLKLVWLIQSTQVKYLRHQVSISSMTINMRANHARKKTAFTAPEEETDRNEPREALDEASKCGYSAPDSDE